MPLKSGGNVGQKSRGLVCLYSSRFERGDRGVEIGFDGPVHAIALKF